MGETLEWTVAACDTALGCSYQPARSAFRVPIVDGTWDSIYAVTQDPKCKNCHQMFAENANYQRHITLNRFTREQNPSGQAYGTFGHTGCDQCHTAATGYVDGWFFPPGDRNLDVARTDQRLCQVMSIDQEGSLDVGTGAPHLLGDSRVRWGVDHIPGLGFAGWQQRFNKWTTAGRPCCSSPKPGGCVNEPPHGQFGFTSWNTNLWMIANSFSETVSVTYGSSPLSLRAHVLSVAPMTAPAGGSVLLKQPAPVCDNAADLQDKALVVSTVAANGIAARELFRACQDLQTAVLNVIPAGGGWQNRVRCVGLKNNRPTGTVRLRVQPNSSAVCEVY